MFIAHIVLCTYALCSVTLTCQLKKVGTGSELYIIVYAFMVFVGSYQKPQLAIYDIRESFRPFTWCIPDRLCKNI